MTDQLDARTSPGKFMRDENQDELFHQCRSLLLDEDGGAVQRLLDRLPAEQQDTVEALVLRAKSYEFSGPENWRELELACIGRALELDPENVEALRLRAGTYDSADRVLELADWMHVARLAPGDIEARTECGRVLEQLECEEDARNLYREAVSLTATTGHECVHRALAWDALGDHAAALHDFSEAIRLAKDDHWPVVSRAVSHEQHEEYEAAIRDYTEGLRLAPIREDFLCSRAKLLDKAGHHERAIADFTEFIQRNPSTRHGYWDRAHSHEAHQDFELAAADWTEVIRLTPSDDPYYSNNLSYRANCWHQCAQYEKAISDLLAARRLQLGNGLFDERLVEALVARHKRDILCRG